MNFIYQALKKAEREGKLDSTWFPRKAVTTRHIPLILTLPQEIIKEFSPLKLNIQQAHSQHNTQIIGITSSISGEGRSSIAYNLALVLAQSILTNVMIEDNHSGNGTHHPRKNGVLLIDGDLKRPILHQLFNVSSSPGLTDFIIRTRSRHIVIKNISTNYLNLITAGNHQHVSQEVWTTNRMKKLLAKYRDQFEYILIDAPPVIGHPETLALAKLTDGLLFVIKANYTRWEVVKEAKQQLNHAGLNILGVVLNQRKYFIPELIYKRL